jgi:hypothetical protein
MTEDELIERCKPYPITERIVFHANVQYGFGNVLRKMALYPKFLPICAYFEHSSPPFYDETWDIDRNFLTHIFFHRKDFAEQWNEKFRPLRKATARTFTSPFVWYKEKEEISVSDKAKGSLFFIHHTRVDVERKHDKQKIIEKINQLDASFHPVTFCFYYLDIQKGLHKEYQELGFDIVTAGHKENPQYIDQFYQLIRNYKFALTNSIGGHLLFSVNLGIPVSYFEDLEPTHESTWKGFEDSRTRLKNSRVYQKAKQLFQGEHQSITTKQLQFVNTMLGVGTGTTRGKLMWILYQSFFSYAWYRIKKKIR